jgi:hypothetical protein
LAEVYLETKAGFFLELPAGTKLEDVPNGMQDTGTIGSGREGAEIGSRYLSVPNGYQPGKGIVGKQNIRVGLGVFEVDIIPGLVFFNKGVFQDQGLQFIVCDQGIHFGGFLKHNPCFGRMILRNKVAANPVPEVLGLSDIENPVLIVQKKINTWGPWDQFDINHRSPGRESGRYGSL